MQCPEHLPQHLFLLRSSVVLVLGGWEIFPFSLFLFPSGENDLVLPVSSLIAHPDRVLIIPPDMAPSHAQRAAIIQRPITADVKVIPRILPESLPLVRGLELLDRKLLTRASIRAVHHNQLNLPRCSSRFRTQQAQQFRP